MLGHHDGVKDAGFLPEVGVSGAELFDPLVPLGLGVSPPPELGVVVGLAAVGGGGGRIGPSGWRIGGSGIEEQTFALDGVLGAVEGDELREFLFN